jgi:uncharacterized protein YndB with AHSA1/START domain
VHVAVTSDDGAAVVLTAGLPMSTEHAYAHFTDPELLTAWWPEVADTDPSPGGRYHLQWPGPGWHLHGEYAETVPGERLSFTWAWDHEDAERFVTIGFRPDGDDTHLTVEHTYGGDEERDGYVEGWVFFLGRLAGLK